ncbi:hypothetical protein KAF25_007930 [Fusarium avenaceum]|uniref:Carboxylic ester hydrolase n=1 Tax=Fusarium avenaceum TaxID=40199 RepID=A0A9P7H3U8_9HYPO|nr:hypothetical protein KAF25_007930 [Fusarium avenaceum]
MQYVASPGVPMSEDCLSLNIVRPTNINQRKRLPVAVWIHGYLTEVPITVFAINAWLYIGFFGGDPRKVTLFGQSAGVLSTGKQLIAYGGQDDGLFRAAIMQSGGMAEKWPYNIQDPYIYTETLYQNLTTSTGCADKFSPFECLRSLPVERLSKALNISNTAVFSGTGLGPFNPVPIMYTTATDEATVFMYGGKIDTDEDFRQFVALGGPDRQTVSTIEMLYPNINSVGLPAGYEPSEGDDL